MYNKCLKCEKEMNYGYCSNCKVWYIDPEKVQEFEDALSSIGEDVEPEDE
jgi:hypothetical protein